MKKPIEMDVKKPVEMEMFPVESEAIKSIGYNADARTMGVEFNRRDGTTATYHYPDTSPEQHQDLRLADSIGAHFNEHHRKRTAKLIT